MRLPLSSAALVCLLVPCYSQEPRLPLPKIVGANPGFWARDVPPTTGTISLTFDQPMRPGFSAWAGPSALLPEEFGAKERFSADLRSLGLDVKLAPGNVYVFGINERGKPGVGFQNAQGTSVPPHFLVFQTAGQPAPEKAPPVLKESIPKNFDMSVDPAKVRSLAFTFDRPMVRDAHGLTLTAGGVPVDLGEVPFQWDEEGTTLTLNHQPDPNTLYRATLNSTFDIGFRSDLARIPLWPVTVTFRTTNPSEPMEANLARDPVADTPPLITDSSPEFWGTGIDPAIDRVSLTFDQPLRAGYSAWAEPGSLLPESSPLDGDDGGGRKELYSSNFRTVSLPVSLQRGRIYVFALNGRARQGVGFQNAKGIPSPTRYLVFRTRGIPPLENRPPEFRGMVPDPTQKIPVSESSPSLVKLAFDRPMSRGNARPHAPGSCGKRIRSYRLRI